MEKEGAEVVQVVGLNQLARRRAATVLRPESQAQIKRPDDAAKKLGEKLAPCAIRSMNVSGCEWSYWTNRFRLTFKFASESMKTNPYFSPVPATRAPALRRSAEWHSAVSPIGNRQTVTQSGASAGREPEKN
jgi:hypothetical protein